MGCNSSTEEVDVSVLQDAGATSIAFGGKTIDTTLLLPHKDAGDPKARFEELTPRTDTTLPETAGSRDSPSSERAFPLPEGWRVVCRLSAGDVRSRWGTRPRPAPAGAQGAGPATAFEADLVMPEASQPLRLPLQLLTKWAEPRVGGEFAGRFQIKRALPQRPYWHGCRSRYFEAVDQSERAPRAIQVCDLVGEVDVKIFVERLQVEALDSENRLFLRLRDVIFSLPRHLAVIEDIPRRSLWDDFEKLEPSTNMVAKVGGIANAILAGLSRLHSCGWAHCSVSPDTVCLAMDGAWKLTGLESARRLEDLALGVASWSGAAHPPEALLGLAAGEKVDVWHLAAALCEALARRRVHGGEARRSAELLCALVDFLGPLPGALVAQHPAREEFFTPEGHVLRQASPDHAGAQALEAIEPLPPGEAPAEAERGRPRPRLVVQALQGREGAEEVLDFLGRLLAPDPSQRPSAKEALEHLPRPACEKHAHIEDGGVETCNKIQRKGTGFVHIGELPDEEEEEEEEEEPASHAEHVKIQDSHGDNENSIRRKGTGFIHRSEIPDSDDEDEEEEDEEEARPGHVHIESDEDHKTNTLVRKGTGFVHIGELPESDEEEDDDDGGSEGEKFQVQQRGEKHATVVEGPGDHESHLQRKGTGFVHLAELPPSDEEDEEEDEEEGADVRHTSSGKHATIVEGPGDHEHHLVRKGTGFVHLGELPPSDDEDEEEEEEEGETVAPKSVRIAEAAKTAPKAAATAVTRKGTGFVRMDELPDSDEGSEEEEEEQESNPKASKAKVGFQVKPQRKVQIQGTEDSGSREQNPKGKASGARVRIEGDNEDDGKRASRRVPRKGTAFAHAKDAPPDFDLEEDEASQTDAAKEPTTKERMARKGTGFVNISQLPDSDEEEEEDEADDPPPSAAGKKVRIAEDTTTPNAEAGTVQKAKRAGTQIVSTADLNLSSEEEEEDDED